VHWSWDANPTATELFAATGKAKIAATALKAINLIVFFISCPNLQKSSFQNAAKANTDTAMSACGKFRMLGAQRAVAVFCIQGGMRSDCAQNSAKK